MIAPQAMPSAAPFAYRKEPDFLPRAQEQRRRFVEEMDIKQRVYGERYPLDEDLLHALTLMPEASGVALGLDRVIMLATGATAIGHVQWVPVG